jgi:hypothetical protein
MGRWTERNRWRRGQWLVRDDESGFVHYADQVVRRWDGMYVRKDQDEPIDPQWFITAESDPTNVPFVRPDQPAGPACKTGPAYDAANQPIKSFPGYNLYVGSSIGSMEIECSFIVFPDTGPYPPR